MGGSMSSIIPSGSASGTGSVTLIPVNTNNNQTVTFPDASGTIAFNNQLGMRNRIINGAMVIDQRNAGASVTINSGANTYTVDRWFATGTASAGVFTVAQSTSSPPTSFTNFLRTTVTTVDSSLASTDFYGLCQRIEGFNTADLNWGTSNAQTVTLSFKVRSSLTGTFTGCISGTPASSASYVFSYTINSANTWEDKTITIAGPTFGTFPTNNTASFQLWFSLGLGSNYTGSANAWTASAIYGVSSAVNIMATNGATFDITGVQLEVGSSATGYEYRQYQQELALCQRYYAKITNGADGNICGFGTVWSGTTTRVAIQVPQQMRATPSGLMSGTLFLYGGGSFKQVTALSGVVANSSGYKTTISIDLSTSTAMPNTQALVLTLENTNSYLEFPAEL